MTTPDTEQAGKPPGDNPRVEAARTGPEPVSEDEPDADEGIEDVPLLDQRDDSRGGKYRRAIFAVPVDVVVSVGQARPVIGELLAMRRDMVLPLSSHMDDPVDILVGDRVIARGELEELGDESGRLGVRLTEVVDVSDLF